MTFRLVPEARKHVMASEKPSALGMVWNVIRKQALPGGQVG
jgi:hypothetical protein